MIKRYNENKNISAILIKNAREHKGISRIELSKLLELRGVYINRNELRLMEQNELMVKDFELAVISDILDIDLNNLKDYLED